MIGSLYRSLLQKPQSKKGRTKSCETNQSFACLFQDPPLFISSFLISYVESFDILDIVFIFQTLSAFPFTFLFFLLFFSFFFLLFSFSIFFFFLLLYIGVLR